MPSRFRDFYRRLPRWLVHAIKYLISGLILYFLYQAFRTTISQLDVSSIRIPPAAMIFSLVMGIVHLLTFSLSWHVLSRSLGSEAPAAISVSAWIYSQLGKYLPGKIWLYVGRLKAYQDYGWPPELIGAALYAEIAFRAITAAFIFIATGPSSVSPADIPVNWLAGSMVLIAIFVTTLYPPVFFRLINFFLGLIRKPKLPRQISVNTILMILGLEVTSFFAAGTGLYILAVNLSSLPVTAIFKITGALAVASLAGLLAVFVPSGLGVREGVFIYLLNGVIPLPQAIVLAVIARIWILSTELFTIFAVWLLSALGYAPTLKRTAP